MENRTETRIKEFEELLQSENMETNKIDELVFAFRRGYNQGKNDTYEDMFIDGDVLPKADAVDCAINLFHEYASVLIDSLSNIANNFKCMAWCTEMAESEGEPGRNMYFRAKAEAFEEFVDRLKKEYDMLKQTLMDTPYNPVDHIVYEQFRKKTNEDVDWLLPENQYHGSRDAMKLMRFKGKLANLLEGYISKGFQLGRMYNSLKTKEGVHSMEQTFKQMLDEFNFEKDEDVTESIIKWF